VAVSLSEQIAPKANLAIAAMPAGAAGVLEMIDGEQLPIRNTPHEFTYPAVDLMKTSAAATAVSQSVGYRLPAL
jgi:hypothetical protein